MKTNKSLVQNVSSSPASVNALDMLTLLLARIDAPSRTPDNPYQVTRSWVGKRSLYTVILVDGNIARPTSSPNFISPERAVNWARATWGITPSIDS